MSVLESTCRATYLCGKPFPTATVCLALFESAVFLILLLSGTLELALTTLGLSRHNLLAHRVWIFFTAPLLHLNLVHVCVNMAFLLIIGFAVEPLFGKLRFLFLVCASALISMSVSSPFIEVGPHAGLSGSIYAMAAAYFVLFATREKSQFCIGILRMKPLRIFVHITCGLIVLDVLITLSAPFLFSGMSLSDLAFHSGIDLVAHLGGFISGAAICCYFAGLERSGLPAVMLRRTLMAMLIVVTAAFAVSGLRSQPTAVYFFSRALPLIESGADEKAVPLLEQALARQPQDAVLSYYLARSHLKLGRVAAAESVLLAGLTLENTQGLDFTSSDGLSRFQTVMAIREPPSEYKKKYARLLFTTAEEYLFSDEPRVKLFQLAHYLDDNPLDHKIAFVLSRYAEYSPKRFSQIVSSTLPRATTVRELSERIREAAESTGWRELDEDLRRLLCGPKSPDPRR